jgi:hypothetical protein
MLARALLCGLVLFPLTVGCANLEHTRTTETSGTFRSSGWCFTILSVDIPKPALQIARENASDANLPNTQVESMEVTPDWGGFNWILDILSLRYAEIRGTWGFDGK